MFSSVKKLWLILFIVTGLLLPPGHDASAAGSESGVYLGASMTTFVGGDATMEVLGFSIKPTMQPGFTLGWYLNLPVNDHVSFSPSVAISQKGSGFDLNGDMTIQRFYWLEIPARAVWHISRRFSLNAGPMISFFVGGNSFYFDENNKRVNDSITGDDVISPDIGLAFGAAFNLTRRWGVGVRYTRGMRTIETQPEVWEHDIYGEYHVMDLRNTTFRVLTHFSF